MSKKAAEVSRRDGPYETFKNPKRPSKVAGPYHRKHELPAKSDGAFETKKPLVHVEDDKHHSGRPHPPADRLADAKLLKGKLRKSDEVK